MKKVYLGLLLLFLVQASYGQYQIGIIPRVSPDRAVYQKVGYTEVEIRYGSPYVKDRQIWGGLVPYNTVWRAGANNATTVEFKSKVEINHVELDSGKYGFFVIPQKNGAWTVVFNKVAKQWGAFKYDSAEDALRVEVHPKTVATKKESLTYSIHQDGYSRGSIVLAWEYIELEIPFETNYLSAFEVEIESRASQQPEYIKWIPYIQGAEHLEQLGLNIDLANQWINQAESIMRSTSEWNEQFYPREYVKGHLFWAKAKLLARNKDFKAALAYVDQLKNLENTAFYDRQNEGLEIDGWYDSWTVASKEGNQP